MQPITFSSAFSTPMTVVQSYMTARVPALLDTLRTMASPVTSLDGLGISVEFGMNHCPTRPTDALFHLNGGRERDLIRSVSSPVLLLSTSTG